MNTTITINNTLQADVERDRLLDRLLDELEPAGPMITENGLGASIPFSASWRRKRKNKKMLKKSMTDFKPSKSQQKQFGLDSSGDIAKKGPKYLL